MSSQPSTSGSLPRKTRVASLLPSATDVLRCFNCLDLLVARTHDCDWAEVQHIAPVTTNTFDTSCSADDDPCRGIHQDNAACTTALQEATLWGGAAGMALLHQGLSCYSVDLPRLAKQQPTVILTQLQGICPPAIAKAGAKAAQRHLQQQVARLEALLHRLLGYKPVVVHLAANDLGGVWEDMRQIADAVGRRKQGEEAIQKLQGRLDAARNAARGRLRHQVVCIQWLDPWFAAGSWVPQLLRLANAHDMLGRVEEAVELQTQQIAGESYTHHI